LVLVAVACSGAKATKITEANKDSVLMDVKDSRDFTVEEVGLLMSRQIRVAAASALHQPPPGWVGMTLQGVIDDERKIQKDADAKRAEGDRLAAEAKAKEDAVADELRKCLVLSAYDKGFRPTDPMNGRFDAFITLKYAYENKSSRDIRAFRGSVRFADLFDKEIITSGLTVEDPIKAGAKATWSGEIKYNQFLEPHQALMRTDLKDMKVTWIPTAIIFSDGTQIGGK
jgi:hypothetical protein